MTWFTDSPFERMMTRIPKGNGGPPPPPLPPDHPCYGCGNYGAPCAGFCHREIEARWKKGRKR